MVMTLVSGCLPWWCRCLLSSVPIKLFLKFSEAKTPRAQPQQDRYHWNWFMSDLIMLWLHLLFLLKSNTDTCQWNELHITYNVKTSSIHLQLKWIITTYNSYIQIMKTEKIIAVKVVRGICFRIERERERDHFKYLGSKWERKRGGRVSEPLCPTTDYSNVTLALQLQLPCNQLSITTATTTTTTTTNIANDNGQEIPLLLRWKMIPIKP